jgi:signal transduction histidine kinase/CheY-like chemotaxis protein
MMAHCPAQPLGPQPGSGTSTTVTPTVTTPSRRPRTLRLEQAGPTLSLAAAAEAESDGKVAAVSFFNKADPVSQIQRRGMTLSRHASKGPGESDITTFGRAIHGSQRLRLNTRRPSKSKTSSLRLTPSPRQTTSSQDTENMESDAVASTIATAAAAVQPTTPQLQQLEQQKQQLHDNSSSQTMSLKEESDSGHKCAGCLNAAGTSAAPLVTFCQWLYGLRYIVSELLIVATCMILIAYAVQRNHEAQEEFLSKTLHEAGSAAEGAINAQLRFELLFGHNLQTSMIASPNRTREQFDIWTRDIIPESTSTSAADTSTDSIMAISWAQHVTQARRSAYEAYISEEYGGSRTIRHMVPNPPGSPVPTISLPRPNYFPITFVSPFTQKSNLLVGTDILEVPSSAPATALLAAITSGEPVATAPVEFPHIGNATVGFMVYFPVYGAPYHLQTAGANATQLFNNSDGSIGVSFRLDKILQNAMASQQLQATSITLCDVTDPDHPTVGAVGQVSVESTFQLDQAKRFTVLSEQEQVQMCKTLCEEEDDDDEGEHDHNHECNLHAATMTVATRKWIVLVTKTDSFDDLHASSFSMRELIWVSLGCALIVCTLVVLNARRLRRRANDNERLFIEAREANEAKSTFVAFLCHELRNPLHAVISAVDELEDTNTPEDVTNALTIGSQTMLSIVNDILDMSKIQAGAFNVSFGPVNLKNTLGAVISSYQAWASASGIHLSLVINPDVPGCVVTDQTRISQVLNNLISNALKFSDEGDSVTILAHIQLYRDVLDSEEKCVRHDDHSYRSTTTDTTIDIHKEEDIASKPQGSVSPSASNSGWAPLGFQQPIGTLILSVCDSGAGMTESQVAELFSPYHQIKDHNSKSQAKPSSSSSSSSSSRQVSNGKQRVKRNFAGTGIGLTIVNTIINALGGDIVVESEVGHGSTFHVNLPLILANLANQDSEIAGPTIPDPTTPDSSVRYSASRSGSDSGGGSHSSSMNDPTITAAIAVPPAATTAPAETETEASFAGIEMVECDMKIPMSGAAGSAAGTAATTEASRPVLLIVDDDRMNRKILRRHASRMLPHVELVDAINGQEALDFATSEDASRIACICMDLNMPVMGGLEATRKIRALRGPANVHNVLIIGVTANAFAEDRQNCFDAGMDDVLPKPFRKQQFCDIIAKRIPSAS